MEKSLLDKVDEQIIAFLLEDGRASYADIGRKVNLSRTAVRDRINILLKKGIIEKFSITLNPYKMGYEMSFFFEIDVEPRYLIEVATKLAEVNNILSINQMSGPSTIHVHALLRDKDHLESFLMQTIYSLQGITNVRSYMMIRRFKSKSGSGGFRTG